MVVSVERVLKFPILEGQLDLSCFHNLAWGQINFIRWIISPSDEAEKCQRRPLLVWRARYSGSEGGGHFSTAALELFSTPRGPTCPCLPFKDALITPQV